MKFPPASWFVVIVTAPSYLTLGTIVAAEQQGVQDNSSLRPPRRNRQCPDGFGGNNCNQNIDECRRSPYPCTGGVGTGSFCVDFSPPEKFKCGCRTGYNALLPDALDVTDHVPVDWRPLKCIPKDVCVDVVCHEDATCNISSSNTPICICNDNLVGDGITSCSPPPRKPPSPQEQSRSCKVDSDCSKLPNSDCVESVCKCKNGFYLSSGKGQCINENECADGFPNRCHRDAICTDTEGSYTCACKDGYQELGRPSWYNVRTSKSTSASALRCTIATRKHKSVWIFHRRPSFSVSNALPLRLPLLRYARMTILLLFGGCL
jgi:hypothetical protein